MNRDSW